MKRISLALATVFVFLLFNTCEKDDNESPPSDNQENIVYDVTLTDNTVFIDSLQVSSLVKVDTADYIYYFTGSDPKITNLQVDDILFIYGLALRRVKEITHIGDTTRVETGYATLNEAIRDGEISWNKEINFSKGVIPVVQMRGENIPYKSTGADDFEFEFKYGDYKYRIKFTFSDTAANVEFEITKELVQSVTAKFLATGSIENFYSRTEMKFTDSKLTNFGQKNSDIKGNLTLKLIVAGSGRDNIAFDFPVVLLKFPMIVGGMPIIINVKVLFVINCVVPVDGSSQVEVKFSYNSTTGIKYNGTEVSADASIGERNMEESETPQTGASTAIGANFGLAFPRLEIGMFGEKVVPWIQTAFLIGGDYTFTPPCQQSKCQFIGACGIDFSFYGLGLKLSKTLWQEEKVLMQTAECPEE